MPQELMKGYEGKIDVPVEAIQTIDPAVKNSLPPSIEATSIAPHGKSYWNRTARIDTASGLSFFLKTASGDRGRGVVSAEYVSMQRLVSACPPSLVVPKPIATGSYVSMPHIHFLLYGFYDMTNSMPDVETFPSAIAQLHQRGTSPNGKFGFPIATYHGNVMLEHGWSDTWEGYFLRTTRALLLLEQETCGPHEELAAMTEPFLTKIIPRLLRPLETNGRSIKPCLIHGDLWHANTTTQTDTGLPIVYDACSVYAHNEYELGNWRMPWNRIKDEPYARKYHEHFPISEPVDDYDDRRNLYATRFDLVVSILYKGKQGYRDLLINRMRALTEKFSATEGHNNPEPSSTTVAENEF